MSKAASTRGIFVVDLLDRVAIIASMSSSSLALACQSSKARTRKRPFFRHLLEHSDAYNPPLPVCESKSSANSSCCPLCARAPSSHTPQFMIAIIFVVLLSSSRSSPSLPFDIAPFPFSAPVRSTSGYFLIALFDRYFRSLRIRSMVRSFRFGSSRTSSFVCLSLSSLIFVCLPPYSFELLVFLLVLFAPFRRFFALSQSIIAALFPLF
jgi:hypothetical protein